MSITSELPALVPAETFLATSAKATIDLSVIRVYSDGCVFDVTWVLRRTTESREAWRELFEPVHCRPFQQSQPDEPEPPTGRLRYTLEVADGGPLPGLSDDGGGRAASGGNDACFGSSHLLLSPLPPPGELWFRLDWPAFGIHDAITILDGTAINQARERIQRL